MNGVVEDPIRRGEDGRGRGQCPLDEAEEQDARPRADEAREDDHDAQGQDQVEAGERKDGDADQHPQRMVAVGEVDPVQGGAVALADILFHLEIELRIVADEPLHEVMRFRKSRVEIDRHDDGDEGDFKPF